MPLGKYKKEYSVYVARDVVSEFKAFTLKCLWGSTSKSILFVTRDVVSEFKAFTLECLCVSTRNSILFMLHVT